MGHSICLLTASLLAAQTPQGGVVYQTQYNPGCNCQQGQQGGNGQNTQSSEAFPRIRGWFRSVGQACAERPGLVNRFRDTFGDHSQQTAKQSYGGQPYAAQSAAGQPSAGATYQPVSGTKTPQTMPSTAQIASQPLPTGPSLETREPELAPTSTPAAAPVSTPASTSGPKLAPPTFRPSTSSSTMTPPARRPSKINPKFANKIGHEDDYSWITGQLDQEGGRWIIRYATPETVDRFHGELPLVAGVNLNGLRVGDLVSATGQVLGQGDRTQYRVVAISLIERK